LFRIVIVTQPSSAIPGFRSRMLLGTGRTSIVYLADNPDGKEVALKVPKPGILQDPVLGRVFYTEVVMLKTLNHPHIVKYFSGEPTGIKAHLAMRYFPEGELNPATVPLEQLLSILRDIASALEYCHSMKVIHQDVKPSNVYVDKGRGFLADFGASSSEQNPTPPAGSPYYMAPEIFRGERGTARTDMYSFSVMAYELLAGRRPLLGDSLEELQVAHLSKTPAMLKEVNPQITGKIAKLVDRGLLKDPAFRPAAKEFLTVFDEVIQGHDLVQTEVKVAPAAPKAQPQEDEGPTVQLGRAPKVASVEKESDSSIGKKGLLGRLFGRKN
jgi:eukaryotic-like serine/threonine-protein kinase